LVHERKKRKQQAKEQNKLKGDSFTIKGERG
jgi:hypothetical protein